jgi:hypothetical protein
MAERTFTDVELERLLANDLPAARAAELESKATAADRARLEELRAEHAAFLGTVDVDAEVRAIGKRMAKLEPAPRRPWGRRAWWRWWAAGSALVAAAAAVLLVIRRGGEEVDPEFQTKGDSVSLVVHTPTRRLANGDNVVSGERLRFELVATKRGYVAIIGVDGTGKPSIYVPFGGDAAIAFDPAASSLLPGAIQLDNTPGDETYFAFFSERPFAIDSVLPAVKGGKPPEGITSSQIVLRKPN